MTRDIDKIFEQWKDSDEGHAAFEQARIDNPRYNDGDLHTDAACMDVIEAFQEHLMETGQVLLDEGPDDDEELSIFEEIWACFT